MGLLQPKNTNLLVPNRFLLSFIRLPNMQFFCQTVNIPGLSLSPAQRSTPFVDIPIPGDKLIYDALSVTFLVDEDLASWREIHDWMRGMTFPTKFEEYQDLSKLSQFAGKPTPQYSDATLVILDSNQRGNYRLTFKDTFPTMLAPFSLSTTLGPDSILTADATFSFAYFNVEKI